MYKLSEEVRELLENRGQHTGYLWLTPPAMNPEQGTIVFHQMLLHDEEVIDVLLDIPGVLRVRKLSDGEQPGHVVEKMGEVEDQDEWADYITEDPTEWEESPHEQHEMIRVLIQMTLGRSQLEQRKLVDTVLNDYFTHRFQGTDHEHRSGYHTLYREGEISQKLNPSPERVLSGPGRHLGNKR